MVDQELKTAFEQFSFRSSQTISKFLPTFAILKIEGTQLGTSQKNKNGWKNQRIPSMLELKKLQIRISQFRNIMFAENVLICHSYFQPITNEMRVREQFREFIQVSYFSFIILVVYLSHFIPI